jgi:hypothetical protein
MLDLIKPPLDHQPIAEFGRAAIINLGAHYDRIRLFLGHFLQGEPKFLGKMCARDLDEAQISYI